MLFIILINEKKEHEYNVDYINIVSNKSIFTIINNLNNLHFDSIFFNLVIF